MNAFLTSWSFPDEWAEGARLFADPSGASQVTPSSGRVDLVRVLEKSVAVAVSACILDLRIDRNKQVADGRQLISVGRGPPALTHSIWCARVKRFDIGEERLSLAWFD